MIEQLTDIPLDENGDILHDFHPVTQRCVLCDLRRKDAKDHPGWTCPGWGCQREPITDRQRRARAYFQERRSR